MCAISALNPQRFRGYGPSDPRLYQALSAMRFDTRTRRVSSDVVNGILGESQQELQRQFGPSTYLNVPLVPMKDLSSLEEYYNMSALSVQHEVSMSSNRYGQARLKELLLSRGIKLKGKYKRITTQTTSTKRRNKKRKMEEEGLEEWVEPAGESAPSTV
jgi:hypothetical protein